MARPRLPRSVMGWTQVLASIIAWPIMVAMVVYVVWPACRNLQLLGGHDWDQQESYQYLVVKSLLRYHQFPFWNPYACGGHPAWGDFNGDPTLVSPFLPAYLLLKHPLAIRVELIGSGLISMCGTWLFAGRFTRSPAARAFVAVVFAVNGRWALQAAAGHTWHLQYAWMPWVLFFLDRAFADWVGGRQPAFGNVVWAGASLAMMVYMGGLYPVPHTIFVVALYAGAYSLIIRDWRPMVCSVASGIVAFGLSAPKLLPIFEVLGRFARVTDSPESMDLGLLITILTSRDQSFGARPAPVPYWGWHEWGMYIGVVPAVVVVVGMMAARGERVMALRWTAIAVASLAFGSCFEDAPWPLLHKLPIFKSQHVPSRWLYPALLLGATVSMAAVERAMTRAGVKRAWLEWPLIGAVAWIALDIGQIARLPFVGGFEREPPRTHESMGPFRTELHLPPGIDSPVGDWAPHSLPAEMANIGTIDCGTFTEFTNWFRGRNGRAPGLGAKGVGEAGYQGETFVVGGVGQAQFIRWSPNEMVVRVQGAHAGALVAINQNFDAGWSANGRTAIRWADVVAAPLSSGNETVVFRYRPRSFWVGLLIFLVSIGGIAFRARVARRRRAQSEANSGERRERAPTG